MSVVVLSHRIQLLELFDTLYFSVTCKQTQCFDLGLQFSADFRQPKFTTVSAAGNMYLITIHNQMTAVYELTLRG